MRGAGYSSGSSDTVRGTRATMRAFGWLYDVSPDGNRFLMTVATTTTEPSITVRVNWPALLKK
jgi:hypothetical protein